MTVTALNFQFIKEQLKYIEALCFKDTVENAQFNLEKYKRILLLTLIEAIAQTYYNKQEKYQYYFAKLLIEEAGVEQCGKISIPSVYEYRHEKKHGHSQAQEIVRQDKIFLERLNIFENDKIGQWSPTADIYSDNIINKVDYKYTYAWVFYDYRSQLVHAHGGGCKLPNDGIMYVGNFEPEKIYLTVGSNYLVNIIQHLINNLESKAIAEFEVACHP